MGYDLHITRKDHWSDEVKGGQDLGKGEKEISASAADDTSFLGP